MPWFRHSRRRRRRPASKKSKEKFQANKEAARSLVHARLSHFNQFYGFEVHRVFIKNHHSRWGSASMLGNLNFNYKILILSPELQDYVVVHELCHLKEFNHSSEFWALVGEQIPHYQELRHELRKLSL